ncbi:MAG: flavodoxin family protein [Candidatus Omnitrophota bacterium]
MKILLISSSPHKEKSSTYSLAKEALRGLEEEKISHETLHLASLKVSFCKHCEDCHTNILHCSIEDDTRVILHKMLEADGIIFASPNYINQVTGSMKTLFDRSTHFIHCKRLLGKYVIGIATAGSGYGETVLDYINYYANVCGAQYSGGVSAKTDFDKDKIHASYILAKKLAADIREKKPYPGQMKFINDNKDHFALLMKRRKDDYKGEYGYWVEKGWL